jgi:outer membrane protein assembly factor BamE (lipoprotein component of BamABCDE complex)
MRAATDRRRAAARGGRGRWAAALAAALLAGCAAYDGGSLVPGKSTTADVQALMGQPDAKIAVSGGASDWFYTRPSGGDSYAVRVGADGIVQGVEQRLTEENMATLQIGVTTRADVRGLLGPPYSTTYFERQKRDVWGYKYRRVAERRMLWVRFSDDGVVREVLDAIDYDYVPASDSFAKD